MSYMHLDAILKSKFSDEDIVFKEALSVVSDFTPTERCLLIYLLWSKLFEDKSSVSQTELFNDNFISKVFNKVPDFDREWFFADDGRNRYGRKQEFVQRGLDIRNRIIFDLELLQNYYVEIDDSGEFQVFLKGLYPLSQLLMEGNTRYGYEGKELLQYMMDLFGPTKGY